MESQRSGILSTFIMTIPLVIVPALAIFRPPAPASGFTSTDLGAADEAVQDDPLSGFDLESMPAPDTIPKSEETDGLGSEISDSRPDTQGHRASDNMNTSPPVELTPRTPEHPSDPFSADGASPESTPPSSAEPSEASEKILMQQLNDLGAMRTFWFAVPDSKTETGLAVFFRGDNDNMIYRFEAVGSSREGVLRSVHQQVSRWKMKSSGSQRIRQKTDPGD